MMMQDKNYVYMLMEPLMGGDLRQYTLRLPNARLPEEHVQFYVACCVQVFVRLLPPLACSPRASNACHRRLEGARGHE